MKSIILLAFFALVVILGAGYFLSHDIAQTHSNWLSLRNIVKQPTPTPVLVLPKTCSGKLTPDITEGPYYKENSQERTKLREDGIQGEKFTLTGYVFDVNCKPAVHAWIDFWQADAKGHYDQSGYRLRGHQFTDSDGIYRLETIIPGQYEARTPHIHAKVQANPNSPFITTQLYFPAQIRNAGDPIYDPATLINIIDSGNGKTGTYNFVIDVK